jgi:hypothetical protein
MFPPDRADDSDLDGVIVVVVRIGHGCKFLAGD